jgi:hypothetical protein
MVAREAADEQGRELVADGALEARAGARATVVDVESGAVLEEERLSAGGGMSVSERQHGAILLSTGPPQPLHP